MIVAPLLLLGSSVAFVVGGGLNRDEIGGALLVYAMTGMALVAVGITREVEPTLPRGSLMLLVFALLGCGGGIGFGIDAVHAALGASELESAESVAAKIALFVPGAMFPLSFVGLGIALWRARVKPALCGPLLIVAAILFPVANIPDIEALAIAANAMFVIALSPLGVALLRQA